MTTSIDDALRTAHRPVIFAAMLDKAKPGAEFKLIENRDYFLNTLLKEPIFTESLKRAHERGVKTKVLIGPPTPPKEILFNELYGAYAYGGFKNLKKYFMLMGTKDDKPLADKEAHALAESFKRDVLGKERYLIRIQGIVGRLFGKYKTVKG